MLRAHPRHPHLHTKAGDRHSTGDTHYLESIANLLSDATEILITGPAQEKLVFSKHLAAHHPHIAAKVVGVESADHPSAGQLLAHAKKEIRKQQGLAALAVFEAAAGKAGVAAFERSMIEEEPGSGLCLQARYSDLVIIGQNDPDEPLQGQRADLPEYVVMNAGRPVLIVPYAGRFESVGKRAQVAWDGGLEAARAVTAALPTLRRA